jgi:hypothetical protein
VEHAGLVALDELEQGRSEVADDDRRAELVVEEAHVAAAGGGFQRRGLVAALGPAAVEQRGPHNQRGRVPAQDGPLHVGLGASAVGQRARWIVLHVGARLLAVEEHVR